MASGLRVTLKDETPVEGLQTVLKRLPAGRGKIHLMVEVDRLEVELVLPQAYQISSASRSALRSIPGVIDVQDI